MSDKKFIVYPVGLWSGEAQTIEAKDLEEAQEKANNLNLDIPSLCHHCAHEIDIGDVDKIRVMEVHGYDQ